MCIYFPINLIFVFFGDDGNDRFNLFVSEISSRHGCLPLWQLWWSIEKESSRKTSRKHLSTGTDTFLYRLWQRFQVRLKRGVFFPHHCDWQFSRESYKEHNKCVTEQEKYGGANYSAPTNVNKGEKKQNQWFEIVQSAINLNTGSNQAKILLKKLQYYPNTPRKRAKFIVSSIHRAENELFILFIEFRQQFHQRFSTANSRRSLVDTRNFTAQSKN